jgi:UDP-N-acetylglucosamine 3-dehydrogenase
MKVGVIGLGVMGRNHARVLSTMSNVSDVFLYDPMSDEIGSVSGVPVESNFARFLDSGMDYCVISSPTSTHLEIGLELAARKIPALIEKPLAGNPQDGQKLVDAFANDDVVAGVGHVERFNPAVIEMKKKLEHGVLGKVYQISTRRVGPYSGRIRDVGVVKDLASHDIDLVGFLSGSTYENLSSRTLNPLGNSYEDLLIAIGTLSNGSLVSHLVNWVSPTKERVTSVLGEKGMLVADTLSVDLYFYENGSKPTNWDGISIFKGTSEGATHKFELVKNEPLVNEHVAFQNAVIDKNTKGLATLAEGLEVLRVAERIVQP